MHSFAQRLVLFAVFFDAVLYILLALNFVVRNFRFITCTTELQTKREVTSSMVCNYIN